MIRLALLGSLVLAVFARAQTAAPPIVELRQYTLHPGGRDVLMKMFDAYFVEPQEEAGMTVIGQFRNLDDPNKFVWMRGFSDMPSRAKGLAEFYGGPVWKAHRSAANATIIDNDNVLLLRPASTTSGLHLAGKRPPLDVVGTEKGLIVATIYHLDPTAEKQSAFVAFFENAVRPLVTRAGAEVIGAYVPEPSPNNFPGLPVREGEHVFVWFARYHDAPAYARFLARLNATPAWRDSVGVELSSMVREPFVLRLQPSARSLLR